jgi:hypothetical protein
MKLAECDIVIRDGVPCIENIRDMRDAAWLRKPSERKMKLNHIILFLFVLGYILVNALAIMVFRDHPTFLFYAGFAEGVVVTLSVLRAWL